MHKKENTNKNLRKAAILLLNFLVSSCLWAQPGIHGSVSITGTNRDVNDRTWLTADAASGSTTLSVDNSNLNGTYFMSSLSSGDLIMIIQMQGASISVAQNGSYGAVTNYNNVGNYEFRCVSSVPNSNSIVVTVPLTHDYSASGHTQIVRIPRYSSFTLGAGNSIRPAAWNGNSGGVTVIEVSGNAVINGTITATGRGFRGGAFENNTQSASSNVTIYYSSDARDGANKGESIAGFETEYDALGGRFGRGAPANGGGGGNSHNAGGGGGANAGTGVWNGLGNPDNSGSGWSTAWNQEGGSFSSNTSSGGGRGGYTYGSNNRNALSTAPGNSNWGGNYRRNTGGYGGRPLIYSTGRIFMGGGGGAGDGNNSAASGGANGGGLVFIICYGNISGTGVISANGNNASNTSAAHNDAPGGGGGGGTIILSVSGSIANSLTLNADGGNGGSQLITNNESEGPGGGGGGGYIAITSGNPSRSAAGGSNGITTSAALTEFVPNGATAGADGIDNASFSMTAIIGDISANAGIDRFMCEYVTLEASNSANAIGTWTIISGTGGSFSDIHDPNAIFTGDSFVDYTLEWLVVNNLCESARDTVFITSDCQPLPVELISFNAHATDNGIMVKWVTAGETNLNGYVLEKLTGGGSWTAIATLQAGDGSPGMRIYLHTDPNPNPGNNTYRLRLVHHDATELFTHSIVYENRLSMSDFIVYPMPFGESVTLSGGIRPGMEYRVFGISGNKVAEGQFNTEGHADIELRGLDRGAYILSIYINGTLLRSKMIFRE